MSRVPGSAVASAPGEGPKRPRGSRVSRSPVDPRTLPTTNGALSMIVDGLCALLNGYERSMREEAGRFYANERSRQEEMLTLNEVHTRYGGRKNDLIDDIKNGKLVAQKVSRRSKDGSISKQFEYRIKSADAEAWFSARTTKAQKGAPTSAIPGRGASFYADSGTSSIPKSVPPTGSSWSRSG